MGPEHILGADKAVSGIGILLNVDATGGDTEAERTSSDGSDERGIPGTCHDMENC